ncbi:MAG: winged helix-turn-helix domain-containing protein [Verrucomicrobiales bacterium]|jgi:DNA-binding response OmpR family regulator|nr:winged helix-turn-helix domain-containing protein [Verrucomicrobiales bacterium]
MQICEHVWNYNFDPDTNLVDVYIQRLRKKVDKDFPEKLIETVRGVGYRIGKPDSARSTPNRVSEGGPMA